MNRAAHDQPHTSAHPAEHLVHLSDDHESLAESAAAYVRCALESDAAVVVVSSVGDAIAQRLEASGVSVTTAIARGVFHVYDAATTLKRIMKHGRPDGQLLNDVLGSRIAELTAAGRRIWLYGDMGDLLAAEGDLNAVQQLEELGNGLTAHYPLTLMCGYTAVNFGNPRTAPILRQICHTHSDVRCNPADTLSSFLIGNARTTSPRPVKTTA